MRAAVKECGNLEFSRSYLTDASIDALGEAQEKYLNNRRVLVDLRE